MTSRFQNRIVGTVILVAAGVIFLPDIFDGKKQHYKEEFAKIPIKPTTEDEVESFDILLPVEDVQSLPDSSVVVESALTPTFTPTTDLVKADEVAKETKEANEVDVVVIDTPSSSDDYQKSAWIIQLASLKNVDNANLLVSDLQSKGYQAHIIKDNEFNRVVVGPDISKEKLSQQLDELKKITGSQGYLTTFNPINP